MTPIRSHQAPGDHPPAGPTAPAWPASARRALGPEAFTGTGGDCYGRTLAGTACQLPGGHPGHHAIALGGNSWFSWTDRTMADFARIAAGQENIRALNREHRGA